MQHQTGPKPVVGVSMRRKTTRCLLALTCWCLSPVSAPAGNDTPADAGQATRLAGKFWPQWRGPLGTGQGVEADPPIEWSEDRNVRWKLRLRGLGHSTPIVWSDRVFVTAAVPYGTPVPPKPDRAPGAHDNLPVTRRHMYVVLAIHRTKGQVAWQRTLAKALPHEGGHYTGSLASASPVTDGTRVFAHFGSRGLYCLDFEGRTQWQFQFGEMQTKHGHGEGSSPVVYGNTLVVNWDHEGQSFAAALDTATGKQIWKVARNEVTSWATPIVVSHAGQAQVIISGTQRVRSYDLSSGRVLWECGGLSRNIVASPVSAKGMVFAASSYDTRALLAIRLDGARGDITGTKQVAWGRRRGTPYVPSPLLYKDTLYFLSHYQGILSRVRTISGEERTGPIRLNGIRNVYASPVAAADRVYITDRDGTTLVISHAESPTVLARNTLQDSFSASAALVGNELFLRGQKFLYCIGRQ